MAVRRIRAGGGLATDPTELELPEALRVADNVLLHRPGTIQPRPGFGDTTGIEARTTDSRPIAIVPFDGDLVVQQYDSILDQVGLVKASADAGFSSGESLVTPAPVSSFMQARGSLYYTTADGVKKLADISDSDTTKAGAWMTYQAPQVSTVPATDVENAALEADTSIAYRWCVVRTDSNGYEVRSSPSARTVWAPFDATSYPNGLNMDVGSIYLPSEAQEGDVLELYRTRNSGDLTADPGEDYFLVAKYALTSTDISNGFTSDDIWLDNVKDHALGVSLYTSASQFGALAAKEIPPYCALLSWWGSVAWAANLNERALETITVAKVYQDDGSAPVNSGTGLCTFDGSYTGVSGNKLTGVSLATADWPLLLAGQWISDSAPTTSTGRIPTGTRVVSFDETAQEITLSQAPSGSGTFKAGDIVEIQSVQFFAYETEGIGSRWFDVSNSDSFNSKEYGAALSLARVVTAHFAGASDLPPRVYALKDEVTVNGDGGIVFLAASPGNQFTIQSIRGSAFVPNITDLTTITPTDRPGGLAWSAPEEPEAWPPANYLTVGQRDRDVLALVPTRDALLVWKEDGLYAVVGAAPSSWSVHEVDTSVRLLAPQCTCVLDGVCYALTNRGVVAASAGGVQVVSGPIAAELRAYQRLLPLDNADHKRAWWMVAHQRLGLVVLGVGATADSDATDAQYIFHARAGGRWARWTRADRCAAYDPAEDRMVVSPGIDAWSLLYERADESDPASYVDASIETEIFGGGGVSVGWDGDTATIDQTEFGGHIPAAGDVIQYRNAEIPGSGRISRVVGVEEGPPIDGPATYLVTVESGEGMGKNVSWYQAIPAAVEWHPQHLPGHGSRWSEEHVVLEGDASEYLETWPLDIGGQRSEGASADMLTATITPNGSPYQSIRAGVPRAIVRAYQMGPRIAVNAAGVLWRVAELALHFVGQGRRVRR